MKRLAAQLTNRAKQDDDDVNNKIKERIDKKVMEINFFSKIKGYNVEIQAYKCDRIERQNERKKE